MIASFRQVSILVLITVLSFGCARKQFFAPTPLTDAAQYELLQSEAPAKVDSVTLKAGKHYKASRFHNFFWGKHYRPLWTAPVRVKVFDINVAKGGLKFEKLGGGMQTTSLTLVDENGFSYALRSIDKDPIDLLPGLLKKTFVANVLRDQTSAINPYAALVLPPLIEAAGIPHSTPELVYVLPTDTSFGENSAKFQDRLFMIEEKYTDKNSITSALGKATDVVGSDNMLHERFDEDDHFIDQKAFGKARLFDIFINDWDRHEGQWNWAVYKEGGETIYRPIPKDRDNAFFKFDDGIIPWLFSRNWAPLRKFETFSRDYKDVYALHINAKFIDSRALSKLTSQDFDSIALELQSALTDEVIERAVRNYPDTIYKLEGAETIAKLKSRRDQLPYAAREFYKVLAKKVMVIGTDEEDIFEVIRLNDEETAVTVKRNSDNKQTYHRVFYRSETDRIILHGLDEDDKFTVSGEVKKGIPVVIVGGRGEDEIKDASRVKGWSKHTLVYDTKNGTELKAGPETKDNRKNDVSVHAFDREGF